jgi:hypothetical protein
MAYQFPPQWCETLYKSTSQAIQNYRRVGCRPTIQRELSRAGSLSGSQDLQALAFRGRWYGNRVESRERSWAIPRRMLVYVGWALIPANGIFLSFWTCASFAAWLASSRM